MAKVKKIFITGGHFAPAKAVIQELLKRGGYEIYYLGRKYSMEGSSELALEYTEIPTLSGVYYLTLTTGRIQRKFFVNVGQSIITLLKIFIGLAQSLIFMIRHRPHVVMSFGGYVAVPVVLWAWIFGIPVITHEQTTVSGRANRLISYFANKILVSWQQSLAHFPKDKAILTGNPIRQEVIKAGNRKPTATSSQKPLIYITGGSQGARAIDSTVSKILPQLEKKYQIVSGKLSGQESASILARAALVVSRAGANTVTEILFLGKPAILIPLPHTYGQEQEKNGQLVASSGLGEILSQNDLTPESLLEMIGRMIRDRQKYLAGVKQARKLVHLDAASRVVDQIEALQ